MHDLSSRRDCRQQMGAAHLATSLEVFVMLYNEGCGRGLCRYALRFLSLQGSETNIHKNRARMRTPAYAEHAGCKRSYAHVHVSTHTCRQTRQTWASSIIHALSVDKPPNDMSAGEALVPSNQVPSAEIPGRAKAEALPNAVRAHGNDRLLCNPQLGSNDENVSPQLKRSPDKAAISKQNKSVPALGLRSQRSAPRASVEEGRQEGGGSYASVRETRLAMALEQTVARMRVTRTLGCVLNAFEWNYRLGFHAKQNAIKLFIQHCKGLAVKIVHAWHLSTCRAKWTRRLATVACSRTQKHVIDGYFARWMQNCRTVAQAQSENASQHGRNSHLDLESLDLRARYVCVCRVFMHAHAHVGAQH